MRKSSRHHKNSYSFVLLLPGGTALNAPRIQSFCSEEDLDRIRKKNSSTFPGSASGWPIRWRSPPSRPPEMGRGNPLSARDLPSEPLTGKSGRPSTVFEKPTEIPGASRRKCMTSSIGPRDAEPSLITSWFFLVLICYLFGVLSTVPEYSESAESVLYYLERTVVSIFGAEFLLRLWAAGCRGKYRGIRGRLRYCARALSIIDLLIILLSVIFFTVPFGGQIVATSAVRGFRFVQILRMLHVDRQGGTWHLLKSVIYSHRQELMTTVYVGMLGLTVSSYLLYLVEKDSHPDRSFQTYADSLWWSLITMTTIGYGDKVPSTTAGKILAAICALFTVSFFALPAGILGSGFALKVQQQQKRKRFSRQIPAAATLIQWTWRCYATGRHFRSVACWRLPRKMAKEGSISGKSLGSDARTEDTFSLVDFSRYSEKKKFDAARSPSTEDELWEASGRSFSSDPWISIDGFPHSDSAPELRTADGDNHPPPEAGGRGAVFSDYEFTVDSNFFYSSACREELAAFGHWLSLRGSLTEAQRNAIRAIARMKYYVALKKFQEARRPFDVSDVIEQYSQGYINMTTRIKEIQRRLDNTLGRPYYPNSKLRKPVTLGKQLRTLKEQMIGIENKMDSIEKKLDVFLSTTSTNLSKKLARNSTNGQTTEDSS
ncbi:potassium voltage-gated channel subfamily KQT member 1-like isoform X1 [Centruroides sculpturatus]|uniref:potassium voltage-gated channel subfamily KQT member 1-like isoform X1 n=1 Tax=Centruroides sculpturatus TaxID=218467 RepID=UPI000C6EA9BB|nr:potassium voltage-gated channel subfamily KQT member 1-like isoform X1 [Centruroides sculpturatus]